MNLAKILLPFLSVSVAAAWADEYRPYAGIRHGVDGLSPVEFVASNASDRRIECAASVAHWYAVDLGAADPGQAVRATIWVDPDTGLAALINETGHQMPIESLWCGLADRAASTAASIAPPNHRGAPPERLAVTCRTAGERLACDAH